MLRNGLAVGAVVCCLAACTEENANMKADSATVVPDSRLTDGGSPRPDGAADDAPGPVSEAGVDGPALDMPGNPDMPGSSDMPGTPDVQKLDAPPAPDLSPKPDQGPGGCVTNADCKGNSQFCSLPLGCTPPGVCTLKPKNCPYLYDPVCGCNGQDYANSCLANAAGTSVKHKGTCSSTTCAQIRSDYSVVVAAAKKCSPMLPVVQCVTVVTKDLACGCQTAINKNNAADYAKILALQAQWKTQQCDQQPWPCPMIPCTPVSTGKCDANSGQCVDLP
jgi:hypothetical protein